MNESTKVSIANSQCVDSSQRSGSMWDDAILSAEKEIEHISKRQAKLKRSIRIFRENKKEGAMAGRQGFLRQNR